MAKLIVGIDFGTSTTVVRWRKEDSDEIHVVTDGNNVPVIDSAIFVPEGNGEWIFGRQALNKENHQGKLIRNFKMDLIDPDSDNDVKLYIHRFMEHVYSRFIKDIQAKKVNYDSMDIYISYPVKLTIENRILMKEIISNVGFGRLGTIIGKTEPAAAAIEMMRIHMPRLTKTGILRANIPLNVMMLDMGAGTSDLFIFQLTMLSNGEIIIPEDKIFQYPVSKQPYNCGGREIDELLSSNVLEYLSKGMEGPVHELYFDKRKAKEWKDNTLSDDLMIGNVAGAPSHIGTIIMNAESYGHWNKNKALGEYIMSRQKFENITETHWMNLYKLIENGIAKSKQECKIGAEDIDLIFLTGGHSQWYCVPNLFNGKGINGTIGVKSTKHNTLNFSKIIDNEWKILESTLPQEVVARGLCWPGAINIPSKAEKDVWIRMTVQGTLKTEYSEFKKIISKGEILPYKFNIEKCETEYNTITYTRIMDREYRKFNVSLEIVESDPLEILEENLHIEKFQLLIDDSNFVHEYVTSLLYSLFSITADYKFTYTADINMLEDGTLELSGKLKYDDWKEYCFTEKDFKIL